MPEYAAYYCVGLVVQAVVRQQLAAANTKRQRIEPLIWTLGRINAQLGEMAAAGRRAEMQPLCRLFGEIDEEIERIEREGV